MTVGPISEEARQYLWSRQQNEPFWEREFDVLRREMRDECAAGGGVPEAVASVEEIDAERVPCRLYTAAERSSDVFVWIHGGGWALGDLDCFDSMCRAVANRVPCSVLSVDYRLAPEHVFPAAIDDVWTAVHWASRRFEAVAVGGDSAGGNLAASVALRCRDRGVALTHQLLVYPALEPAVDSEFANEFRRRYRSFRGDNGLPDPNLDFGADSQEGVRRVWEIYIPEPARRVLSDASPVHAASLAGLAPATIVLAEHDILRGEGLAYAARLRSDGVSTEVVTYPGQIHGFFHLLGAFSDARDAVDQVSAKLSRAFGRYRAAAAD
jgi:acetyl esterase